jgi:nitrogen regulatory protein PII
MGDQRTRKATPRRLAALVAAVLVLVALAWIVEWRVTGTTQSASGRPAPGYAVKVMRGDTVLKQFSVAALRALPAVTIIADGKPQHGPTVQTVLTAAGVTSFTTLEVRGMGLRDSGRLTLAAKAVTGDTILDFNDRGTVKIVSPTMDWRLRVRDVTELRVH